ncbi:MULTISPECIES: hypothetical protein [Comamonas]|uniref:hypothetical protein n=1 Tax=Comamonas TaxID=283 RepID=UPI001E36025C|nr:MULTISPECIES: hypothetical protein [Comamonas]UUC96603.1 hypothetical protein NOX35_27215 [Comamonas sp. C11]
MEIPSSLEQWSWLAGIVGAIVAIYTVLKPDKSSSSESRKVFQKFDGENNNYIGENTGNVTINNNSNISNIYEEKEDKKELDIIGRWNLEDAKRICEEILISSDWEGFNLKIEPPLSHEFVNVYFPIYKNKEEAIIIFATKTEGDDCHVSAPHLSIFEFTKKEGGWHLSTHDVAAFQAGSWGAAPNISVHVIGDEKYAIYMEHGWMGQGWIMGSISLHAKIGDSFQEIFSLPMHEYDPEGNGWESALKMVHANTGFYAIDVARKGTRGDQDLKYLNVVHESFITSVADYKGNIRKSDTYKFDGIRYQLAV